MPSRFKWDDTGAKKFEYGVDQGVLYYQQTVGQTTTWKGVVWNGLTNVTESPEGAEPTDIYADNIKYASLLSAENFKATIECLTYPDEFEACLGYAEVVAGVVASQQPHKGFAFCYRTKYGNDLNQEAGYKIHIIYGCVASPSERSNATLNESPETITFSFEVTATPQPVTGLQPTAHIIIDCGKLTANQRTAVEAALYGDSTADATLKSPDEIKALINAAPAG